MENEQAWCLRGWGAVFRCVERTFPHRLNVHPVSEENLGSERKRGRRGRSPLRIAPTDPRGDCALSVCAAPNFARSEWPIPRAGHLCQGTKRIP